MRILYKMGDKLGPYNLTYIKESDPEILPSGQRKRRAIIRCTCGKEFIGRIHSIKNGSTSNCGCGANSNRQKHGMTGTKTRSCWASIKNRCYKESSKNYKFYGARGITMHEPWVHDFMAFNTYISTLEGYEVKGLTMDRIGNDGNYEPGNLRWVSMKVQNSNRRPRGPLSEEHKKKISNSLKARKRG